MRPPDSHSPPPVEDAQLRESEIVIAYFRLGLMLFALAAPGALFGVPREPAQAAGLIAAASAYNIFTALAYYRRWQLRYRRHLLLLMDISLISWWIYISGPDPRSLFPLYYVVVVIAAIWFKVFGAVAAAAVCSGLWATLAINEEAVVATLLAPLPTLFLLAVLAGIISEIHDRERAGAQQLRERVAVYEREIDTSREIQKLLRPAQLPRCRAVELGAADRPSRAVGGGDYYDAFALPDGKLAVCLADVAGKSIRAQSRLPLLKYALRAVTRTETDPARVMQSLNEELFQDLQPDLFVTAVFAVIDPIAGVMRYCNAGHSAPMVFSPNGERPEFVPGAAPALGLLLHAPYRTREIPLPASGGGLVLYTDGVVNATHCITGEFGEERLLHFVQQRREEPAQVLARELVRCVDEFEESTRSDDVTVVVVKRTD